MPDDFNHSTVCHAWLRWVLLIWKVCVCVCVCERVCIRMIRNRYECRKCDTIWRWLIQKRWHSTIDAIKLDDLCEASWQSSAQMYPPHIRRKIIIKYSFIISALEYTCASLSLSLSLILCFKSECNRSIPARSHARVRHSRIPCNCSTCVDVLIVCMVVINVNNRTSLWTNEKLPFNNNIVGKERMWQKVKTVKETRNSFWDASESLPLILSFRLPALSGYNSFASFVRIEFDVWILKWTSTAHRVSKTKGT